MAAKKQAAKKKDPVLDVTDWPELSFSDIVARTEDHHEVLRVTPEQLGQIFRLFQEQGRYASDRPGSEYAGLRIEVTS